MHRGLVALCLLAVLHATTLAVLADCSLSPSAAAAAASVASVVTCCFSSTDEITRVAVNGKDFTRLVSGNLSLPYSPLRLSFSEPRGNGGGSNNFTQLTVRGLQNKASFSCHCTRSSSGSNETSTPWNANSTWYAPSGYPVTIMSPSSSMMNACGNDSEVVQYKIQTAMAPWELETRVEIPPEEFTPCAEEERASNATRAPTPHPIPRRRTRSPTPRRTRRPTRLPSRRPTRPTTRFPTARPTASPTLLPTRLKSSRPPVIVWLPSETIVPPTQQILSTCVWGDLECNLLSAAVEQCGGSTRVVVYKYIPPVSDWYTFSTDNALTICSDTTLQIAPQMLCNDDITRSNSKSMLRVELERGKEYTLFVGSYDNACADGLAVSLSVSIATSRPTRIPSTLQPTLAPSFRAPTKRGAKLPPAKTMAPTSKSFNLAIRFLDDNEYATSPAIQVAFDAAARRWTQIITQEFAGFVAVPSGTRCGGHVFPRTERVDDLLVLVKLGPIDGQLGILGSAGPCFVDDLGRSRVGSMIFDTADVDWLVENDAFYNVVLHELGHVLGLGTHWGDLIGQQIMPPHVGGGYEYYGEYGNLGDAEVGGKGIALVEDTGGVGTARTHWKESIYDSELMTGYTNNGQNMPISRLTAQALRDLGYVVDLSMADAYKKPSPMPTRAPTTTTTTHAPTSLMEAPDAARQRHVRSLRTGRDIKLKPDERIPLLGCTHGNEGEAQTLQSMAKPGKAEEFAREQERVRRIQTANRARRKRAQTPPTGRL